MNTHEYLKRHCKPVSQEEANRIIFTGEGIVVGGAYTHYSVDGYHYYHAFGTFPGCMRGGPAGKVNDKIHDWYSVSPLDIVCMQGYRPHEFYTPPESFSKMANCPNWEELNDILTKSGLTESDLVDPDKNAKFWRQYFNKDWREVA